MAKWLQQRDGGNPQIAELWQQLLALAENAQQLNQINGSMIDTRLRNNQQALAILQAAAKQSALYGPDWPDPVSRPGEADRQGLRGLLREPW